MWPTILDIPKEQCEGMLRNLGESRLSLLLLSHKTFVAAECQAYSSLVDAYRAGGVLTEEKRTSLESVATLLNISLERRKAEVRRAVNDEVLNTISER